MICARFFAVSVLAAAFLAPTALAFSCDGNVGRGLALCCQTEAPFSSNSYVWGSICGVTPRDPSEMMGGRCAQFAGDCPYGTMQLCCAGAVGGQCNLGVDCAAPLPVPTSSSTTSTTSTSTTTSSATPSATPSAPPLPGWHVDYPCAVDTSSRVLQNVISRVDASALTPASCATSCAAMNYTHAGVENGQECQCGTGYNVYALPRSAPVSNCSMPCTGDAAQTCGGQWRVQLYSWAGNAPALPAGWRGYYGCAVDTASRVLAADVVVQDSALTPATCAARCGGLGYAYAGVENGNECHCGTGFVDEGSLVNASPADCDTPCSGDRSQTCGAGWRIQIYTSAKA